MSPLDVLLVGLGAAIGAPVRFVCGSVLDAADRWPWGTLLVNLVGSFLLGVLSALALGGAGTALLGTGFCGGLTTYSSLAVQTHRLGPRRGAAYAVVTLGASLALCTVGFLLAA